MAYLAKYRGAPISPRKARLIIDLIRGKDLGLALTTLKFAPQRAAKMLFKVLRSAQANAEDRGVNNVDDLYVSKAWVDEGFRIKRFRPRSRGMANPFVRRRSHLCVELDVRG
jgi:large subunit ribosomal protein L22